MLHLIMWLNKLNGTRKNCTDKVFQLFVFINKPIYLQSFFKGAIKVCLQNTHQKIFKNGSSLSQRSSVGQSYWFVISGSGVRIPPSAPVLHQYWCRTYEKGRYQSGQMGRTVNPLRKLRRFESFSPHTLNSVQVVQKNLQAEVAHLVEHQPSKLRVAGSSPVFRSRLDD